jgi:mannose-1-phosphate guanylyltransferase
VPAAFILAAGLGTRLRPLTDRLPKPLVPIGDTPVLGHVVRRLRTAGFSKLVANAHHHAEAVATLAASYGVQVVSEAHLLGTAGGLAGAAALLGEGDVLVHNGDILVGGDGSLEGLWHAHGGHTATLLVVPAPRGAGNVGVDESGRVVRLRKESFGEETSGGEFTGVHVVGHALRRGLPKEGCLVGDVYLPHLRKHGAEGADIRVHSATSFVDIGSMAGYLDANMAWLAGRSSYVEEAFVDPRVTLEGCVVLRGARVEGAGRLERVVVWPGATATAPLANTVVTP